MYKKYDFLRNPWHIALLRDENPLQIGGRFGSQVSKNKKVCSSLGSGSSKFKIGFWFGFWVPKFSNEISFRFGLV
jgi:hypothetical protein